MSVYHPHEAHAASSAPSGDVAATEFTPFEPVAEPAAAPAHPEPVLSPDEAASRRVLASNPTQTRRRRHDGWTPAKKRLFLERFAESGVILEACEAVGISARSAYNLRDRDPLFAAGWEAATVKARTPLADEAFARARNGVVERIYRDGVVVAERHRYDNRLTMAVLARLDARIDRAEERGSPHLALVARWDDYLDALAEDRSEDAMALLAPSEPAPASASGENAGDRELHELHRLGGEENAADPAEEEEEEDPHRVWCDRNDVWWTDYPPPEGYAGEARCHYGHSKYRRTLTEAEVEAVEATAEAEAAEELAAAAAQRDAWFGFTPAAPADSEADTK
jgi:hypothetical protein